MSPMGDDLDDLVAVPDLTFHDDDETPITPTLCGMEVSGHRTGHCDGAACGFPGEGCCRNFYGINSWNKHYRMNRAKNIKTCHSDARLLEMGYLHDGPHNSWRLPSMAVDAGNAADDDE